MGNGSPSSPASSSHHGEEGARPWREEICRHSCGFTDSEHFQDAFAGETAHSFSPFGIENGVGISPRYHSHDERIAVRDLAFQVLSSEPWAVRLPA